MPTTENTEDTETPVKDGSSASLTVILLTFNEEKNLSCCLKSVAGQDVDIFVVDSGSSDRTREIAAEYGAKVVEHPFQTHARQWRWAFENLPIRTE